VEDRQDEAPLDPAVLLEENARLWQRVEGSRKLRARALQDWLQADRARADLEAASQVTEAKLQQLGAQLGQTEAAHTSARNELAELRAELRAVDAHRQALIQDINSIATSQSWRIGYALTFPVRVFRRGESNQPPSPTSS
jgi:chromosome segregation ATPase